MHLYVFKNEQKSNSRLYLFKLIKQQVDSFLYYFVLLELVIDVFDVKETVAAEFI